eukprot:CAMPEP_0184480672 /NCGR_PEP_ID=MMETSP0113_2-20130426/2192_1 /TAXON_ID=91329 /ORGANISM="Norrisiella sphaerica, Strain BC52" /LENGTH=149 /DNA_ID=CAMNT_0026859309 /DNA_START=396 /DNA_END=845 /DNA_ORIENTATION=+
MMEILCFGQINLWLVPFLYMISLSVNDNVLPGLGTSGQGGGMGGNRGTDMSIKSLFQYFGFGNKDKKSPSGGPVAKKPYYNPNPAPQAGQAAAPVYGGYGGGAAAASYAIPDNGPGSQMTNRAAPAMGGYGGGGYQPAAVPVMNSRKYD